MSVHKSNPRFLSVTTDNWQTSAFCGLGPEHVVGGLSLQGQYVHTRQGWPRDVFSRLEKKVESVFIEYSAFQNGTRHGIWGWRPMEASSGSGDDSSEVSPYFTFQQMTERQEKDRGAEGRRGGRRGLARLLASGERTESGRNLRSRLQWPGAIRWPPCFSAHRKPPYHSR